LAELMRKNYSILAVMGELASAHAEQHVMIEASNWSAAVARGLREILRRPHTKKHRITHMILHVRRIPETSGEQQK
jgi:hypothetical protein